MNWTREKPTQPGWYWLAEAHSAAGKPAELFPAEVVRVYSVHSSGGVLLFVQSNGSEESDGMSEIRPESLWAGPLEPPGEGE